MWKRITQLEKDVKQKSADAEKEAKGSAKMAVQYKNKAKEQTISITNYLIYIKNLLKEAENAVKLTKDVSNNTRSQLELSNDQAINISELNNRVKKDHEYFRNLKKEIDELYQNKDELDQKLNTLNEILTNSTETESKISTNYKRSLEHRNLIYSLYRKVFGYKEYDDNDELIEEHPGYVHELKNAYNETIVNVEQLDDDIKKITTEKNIELASLLKEKEEEINKHINTWESIYKAFKDKIENLLPEALTVGLSHAYQAKRATETKELEKQKTKFTRAIVALSLISTITFVFSGISISNGKSLEMVIMEIPRVVLAIMPLYIPALWVAYSTSKKINLSKRLIEEYTHKEVLSKTYEGLSQQINNIEGNESEELRIKLLFNLINVTSENPGKLITDYNKADHPVTDVLEQSVKLANAVDKLKTLPGLQKVAKLVENKSQRLKSKADNHIEEGLSLLNKNQNLEDE